MKVTSSVKSLAIAGFFMLVAIPTFAATTGSLLLSGVVAPRTEITVTADANASSLPVGSTVSNLKIASVNELSNNKAGYTVSLASANNGQLKESNTQAVGLSDSLPYSLSYNGNPVGLNGGSAQISNISSRTTGAGTDNVLAISFSSAFLNADTYTDTLTFTIAAK